MEIINARNAFLLAVFVPRNKKRIEKFMQTGNTDYIYKNDLDKGCFQHDMAYGNLKIWLKEHNQIKF